MIQISFILPCYNVEKYIADCLESLYSQDISENEYEVICVNDCSTDNTREIILKYGKNHSNLRLIDHDVNKNAGAARNTGITKANGQYIWFVDPDDMIKPKCLSELLEIANKKELDILMFNFDAIDEIYENTINVKDTYSYSNVLKGIDYVETFFNGNLSGITIVWQQLFRKEFILAHNIYFPELRIGEDCIFSWKSILNAEKVQSVLSHYYTYRRNNQSITLKKATSNIFYDKYLQFPLEVKKILHKKNIYPQFIYKDLTQIAKWTANNFIKNTNELTLSEKKKFVKLISRNCCTLLKLPYLSYKSKFIILLSKFGCVFY